MNRLNVITNQERAPLISSAALVPVTLGLLAWTSFDAEVDLAFSLRQCRQIVVEDRFAAVIAAFSEFFEYAHTGEPGRSFLDAIDS
jgi:hypothetical protein